VEEEVRALGARTGPLYRCVYPTPERLKVRAPGEVPDFVADRGNMPNGLDDVVVHKYDDRVLFLITQHCAGHCMYCFRQDVLSDQIVRPAPRIESKLDLLVAYLRARPQIQEVILSGGDPLSVPVASLELVLRRLREETDVQHVRLHTRNVVFAPHTLTKRRCEMLAESRARLVFHVVHPYELVSAVNACVLRARSHGVRCYAQFPLLRGVNDHPRVLERLLGALDDLDVRPLSMFVPDPINYSASFRIGLARLFAIVDELHVSTPAWINAVRVVLDTPIGKVRRDDMVAWDRDSGRVIFERCGQRIEYVDLPQELDVPGDLATLLWKG
jgi:KamA family protein